MSHTPNMIRGLPVLFMSNGIRKTALIADVVRTTELQGEDIVPLKVRLIVFGPPLEVAEAEESAVPCEGCFTSLEAAEAADYGVSSDVIVKSNLLTLDIQHRYAAIAREIASQEWARTSTKWIYPDEPPTSVEKKPYLEPEVKELTVTDSKVVASGLSVDVKKEEGKTEAQQKQDLQKVPV